mgnify:CR=1 FL=1
MIFIQAHRFSPIAMASFVTDGDAAQMARDDAKLTHFDPLAGDVSAATVIICRISLHKVFFFFNKNEKRSFFDSKRELD